MLKTVFLKKFLCANPNFYTANTCASQVFVITTSFLLMSICFFLNFLILCSSWSGCNVYKTAFFKDILHTNFAFNYWWAPQPSFSVVIIGQPPCTNKQPRQNSLTVDLNISPKRWFWIPGQAGGSNFLCPTKSIQILKAKKYLSVNRKVSSIKRAQFTFKLPLQRLLQKNFSLSSQPGGWCRGGCTLLPAQSSRQSPILICVLCPPPVPAQWLLKEQPSQGKLARWWEEEPCRCSSEITALMTAVLCGTAAICGTGQSKSEPS